MVRRSIVLLAVFVACFAVACGDGEPEPQRCDPSDPNACAADQRCVADGDSGVCEDLESCNPDDGSSCPDGFVCRPTTERAVCQPEETAGRIPSCLDSEGIDVFAVEASRALSVTWNVNGDIDSSGGFAIAYGTASEAYDDTVEVGPDVRQASLRPLENGVVLYVVVRALDGNGEVSFTSCEIVAEPNVVEFQSDVRVNSVIDGDQTNPSIAANADGSRLFLAWQNGSAVELSISEDFGDTWSESKTVASGSNADLALRDAVEDEDGNVTSPEALYLAWEENGNVMSRRYNPADDTFGDAVMVGSGGNPTLAIGSDVIHVAFTSNSEVSYASSSDDGAMFGAPTSISGATSEGAAPDIATNLGSDDTYVGWDAIMGGGDRNIYFSGTDGAGFGEPVRVDDGTMGQNQTQVSLAVNERSGTIYATWEDRRGGANVYFSFSDDGGATWAPNVDVGAGLGGDQFRPQAVLDAAGNVYVALQDTTDGARVIFTRFNSDGNFDPPLAPSTAAGAGGVVADNPVVATDDFGAVYVAWQENREGPATDIFFARAE